MAKYVKIASVQFRTQAHRGQESAPDIVLRETIDALNALKGYGLDLVVLSEGIMAIGQTNRDAEEIERPGPFLQAFIDFARAERCHVAGSARIRQEGRVYNSMPFVGPDGEILGVYHKANLTVGAIESSQTSGDRAVVVDTEIGRLGGVICFDLNFEDLRFRYRDLKPDILTFASMYHGGLMQGIWAYECRSYFVSALPFLGGGILDPFGRPVALTDCYSPVAMNTINLDRAMVHLDENRRKFPEIRRKYLDEVTIDVPPNIGPALILSNSDRRSAMDIVREFELELWDDYYRRSLEANAANRIVPGPLLPNE